MADLNGQGAQEAKSAPLIVATRNLEVPAAEIGPDAPRHGEGLGLDSIDMLEIPLAELGVKLRADDRNNKQIFRSLRSLTGHIHQLRASWMRRRSAGGWARAWVFIPLAVLPLSLHLALATKGLAEGVSAAGLADVVGLSLIATSALPHTLIYLALLVTFAMTLLPGRDPLVTALARKMYGVIPGEMVVYTRGVTWLWCGFFAAQLLISLLLFLLAPTAAWSLFVNVFNLPLVIMMFVGEQTYRKTHLRDAPRHSLSDVMRMIGHVGDGVTRRVERTARDSR